MELKELTGKHFLSGVEMGTETFVGFWGREETRSFVKFTLDGVHYMATEDPDDGWRSYCQGLEIADMPPAVTFPPVEVIGAMMPDREEWWETNDVLVLTDAITGKSVLEVGTANTNDYYPCCHFEYHPENMACNAAK